MWASLRLFLWFGGVFELLQRLRCRIMDLLRVGWLSRQRPVRGLIALGSPSRCQPRGRGDPSIGGAGAVEGLDEDVDGAGVVLVCQRR